MSLLHKDNWNVVEANATSVQDQKIDMNPSTSSIHSPNSRQVQQEAKGNMFRYPMRLAFSSALLALAATGVFAQETSDSLLQHLERLALSRNQNLAALQRAWHAAEARIPQAGALPDPALSLNLLNLPVSEPAFDLEPMTGKQVSLAQLLPFPGKLASKETIAAQQAMAFKAQFEEARVQLLQRVRQLYYQLFFTDRAIEITLKNKATLRQFADIASTKYAVGKGLQQDVLRAQVEHSRMLDKLIALRQKRRTLQAQLNGLLDRSPETPIATADSLSVPTVAAQVDSLEKLALEHRPLVKWWTARLQQSVARIHLAKRQRFPDLKVGLAYTQRERLRDGRGGNDFVSLTLSTTLPVHMGRKQNKAILEETLRRSSLQSGFQDFKANLRSQLELLVGEIRTDGEQLTLYRTGIIPQAVQSLDAALAGYRTDKVDFLTLLTSQLILFNYQLEYYRVLRDYHLAVAKLEAATGTDLLER